jgi:hypothetical protein
VYAYSVNVSLVIVTLGWAATYLKEYCRWLCKGSVTTVDAAADAVANAASSDAATVTTKQYCCCYHNS